MSKSRPLGRLERFFHALDAVSSIRFVVYVCLDRPVSEPFARAALEALAANEPLLGIGIRHDATGEPSLVETRAPVELWSHPEWPVLRAAALQHAYAGGRAFVGLHAPAAGRTWLGLGFHHTVMDGRGGMALLRRWVKALRDPPSARYGGDPFEAPELTVSPQQLPAFFSEWMADTGAGRTAVHLSFHRSAAGRGPVYLTTLRLDSPEVRSMGVLARRAGLTLHHLVCACALQAALAIDGRGAATLALHSPVDLRGRGRQDAAGLQTAVALTVHEVELGRSPATLAWDIRLRLDRALARGDAAKLVAILPWLSAPCFEEVVAGVTADQHTAPSCLVVSNLGRQDATWGMQEGIVECGFNVSPLPAQPLLLTVTGLQGRLVIHVHTRADGVDPEVHRRFEVKLRARLSDLARIASRPLATPGAGA